MLRNILWSLIAASTLVHGCKSAQNQSALNDIVVSEKTGKVSRYFLLPLPTGEAVFRMVCSNDQPNNADCEFGKPVDQVAWSTIEAKLVDVWGLTLETPATKAVLGTVKTWLAPPAKDNGGVMSIKNIPENNTKGRERFTQLAQVLTELFQADQVDASEDFFGSIQLGGPVPPAVAPAVAVDTSLEAKIKDKLFVNQAANCNAAADAVNISPNFAANDTCILVLEFTGKQVLVTLDHSTGRPQKAGKWGCSSGQCTYELESLHRVPFVVINGEVVLAIGNIKLRDADVVMAEKQKAEQEKAAAAAAAAAAAQQTPIRIDGTHIERCNKNPNLVYECEQAVPQSVICGAAFRARFSSDGRRATFDNGVRRDLLLTGGLADTVHRRKDHGLLKILGNDLGDGKTFELLCIEAQRID